MSTQHTLLAMVIICVFPLLDWKEVQRMRVFTASSKRINWYRKCIVSLWLGVLAACLISPLSSLVMIGRMPWKTHDSYDYPIVWGIAFAASCALLLLQSVSGVTCLWNSVRRQKIAPAFTSMHYMLPVSDTERRWWIAVSLSAGICEEILFRGYLFNYFHAMPEINIHLGLAASLLLSSLLFGTCHLYQGWQGMVSTAIAGLAFGIVAVVTGNLLLPILLHVFIDLRILWIYRPLLDNPALAARLIDGCHPQPTAVK